jgi:hypothetical protein
MCVRICVDAAVHPSVGVEVGARGASGPLLIVCHYVPIRLYACMHACRQAYMCACMSACIDSLVSARVRVRECVGAGGRTRAVPARDR